MSHAKLIRIRSQASAFGGQVLITMAANVILSAAAVVSGGLAARLLGPEGRGELAAIQTWPTFLASLSMLGLSQSVVYFSARTPEKGGAHFASASSLALLTGLPFAILGYVLMPYVLAAQSPATIEASRLYLLIIPMFTLTGMPQHSLRGMNHLVTWNLVRLCLPVGWIVVLLAGGLGARKDPAWYATGYLFLLAILAVPATLLVRRRLAPPYAVNVRLWKPMLGYGLPLIVASIPVLLNMRLDQMLMAALLAPRALGLYAVAVAWGTAVSPLIGAFGIVLFPRVAASRSTEEGARTLAKAFSAGTGLAVLVGGLVALSTPVLLPLIFGDEFRPAVSPAIILAVANVFASIKAILGEGIRGFGNVGAVLLGEVAGLLATALVLALALRPLGLSGAAVASACGSFVATIVLIAKVRQQTGYTVRSLLWPWSQHPGMGFSRVGKGKP